MLDFQSNSDLPEIESEEFLWGSESPQWVFQTLLWILSQRQLQKKFFRFCIAQIWCRSIFQSQFECLRSDPYGLHGHLVPPMSAQKRRIRTFCKVFEAPRFKLSSALRISAVRYTSEVVGTFSENRVHLDILVSIRMAEIRPPGTSLALWNRMYRPQSVDLLFSH